MPAPLLIVGPTGDSGKYLVTWVNSEYLLLRQYIHHCSAPIILNIGCKFREKKLNPQIFNVNLKNNGVIDCTKNKRIPAPSLPIGGRFFTILYFLLKVYRECP